MPHFASCYTLDQRLVIHNNYGILWITGKILKESKEYENIHYGHRELDIAVVMQTLLTALINVKRTESFSHKYGRYQNELEITISYMKDHFVKKLSVDCPAEKSHLSKGGYIKMFKTYTWQTPYDYLLDLRMQHAKILLLEIMKSEEVVALESGFTDSRSFIAFFKRKTI